MIEKTYLLTLRETPKSVNAGGGGARAHHMAAHREKKAWEGKYLLELMAAKVARPMQFCTVHVTLYWKHRHGRDLENYRHPVIKPLADVLAPRPGSSAPRWLPDDTDEWFQVGEFRFEYPEQWPFTDPRIKSYMDIRLEASYL